MADQWRDSIAGLLRRTGPTTVELLTPTGDAYAINYAAMPLSFDPNWDPRHEVDRLFLPDPDDEKRGS